MVPVLVDAALCGRWSIDDLVEKADSSLYIIVIIYTVLEPQAWTQGPDGCKARDPGHTDLDTGCPDYSQKQ